MRLSGFRWVHRMNSVFGLCLCLVLVGLTTAGAIVYTNRSYTGGILPGTQVCQAEPLVLNDVDSAPAAIGGNKPDIVVWKANPMVLNTPTSAAVYTFKVKLATNVQITEAGTNIKNISNPTGATLQGNVTGLPASAIAADASGQFVCTIVATNDNGTTTKALTLSLAKELLPPAPPAGSTGNQIKNKSRWLEQTGSQAPLTHYTPSTTNPNNPDFPKCPESCKYCMEPGDAASRGFTQKCSDQRCFYDPDNKRSWYCYSEPEGWCCKDLNVSQSTKSECTQKGGYWSTYQAEAIDACQPKGFCCVNGNVYYPTTQAQCVQQGGSYWSTNQAQVTERCQPQMCWCCTPSRQATAFAAGGSVSQMTQAQCQQQGGSCYATQAQAAAACGSKGDNRPYQPPTNLR